MRKKGVMWCLLFVMTFWLRESAFARTTGSIVLSLPQEAAGVELTLYRIAELEDEGYLYCEDFSGCGFVITDLNDSAAAQEMAAWLADYAKQQKLEGTAVVADDSGVIKFTDLPLGLYLAAQTGGETLLQVQPALVPVPHLAETGSEPVYDVTISLKYTFPGGAVIATKVDENGIVLSQAHFILQKKVYLGDSETAPEGSQTGTDENGTFYWKEYQADLVSDKNGQIVLADLPKGGYRLMETQAPDGFVRLEQPREFVIEAPGQVVEIDGIYQESSGNVTRLSIVNEATRLRIIKVDEAGNTLSGASLVIKDRDGKVICDENGTPKYAFTTASEPYVLRGLPAGEYYLSEVQAPQGYRLAADVLFSVSAENDAVNEVVMVDMPESQPPTEPTTEPTTEPATEPTTEPTTEPVTEPATEPATEPTTEPATEATTEPATEPTTEPSTEAITEPETRGSTPSGGSSSPKGNMSGGSSSSVQTGDEAPLTQYAALFAMAAMMLIMLGGRKLKRRQK